jgi:osmotically-inducible protein OsmY
MALPGSLPWTVAAFAVTLLLQAEPGHVAKAREESALSKATLRQAPCEVGQPLDGAGQRAADRMLARQLRHSIRSDRFLALAAPMVTVTAKRGVMRLVGRVPSDKERSSIAFKAGQIVGVKRIEDRVTVGAVSVAVVRESRAVVPSASQSTREP